MKQKQLCGCEVELRETNGDLQILPSTVTNPYRYPRCYLYSFVVGWWQDFVQVNGFTFHFKQKSISLALLSRFDKRYPND